MKMNKVLLVGGSGYIGSHLKEEMKTSFQVFTTSRHLPDGYSDFQINLTDPSTFQSLTNQSFDLVIILASIIEGIGSTDFDPGVFNNNVTGLANFLNFIKHHQLTERVIYISSMTVYGQENISPVGEDASLKPMNTYGLSKKLAEDVFRFFCENSHVRGVCFRIPGVYGGNRKGGFIYNTALKMKKGEPVILNTSGLGYWECIHMADLNSALINFVETYQWNNVHDVFNISYGVSTDFIDCAYKVKSYLNSTSEITEEGQKGYTELYLDNTKINRIINVPDKYLSSLKNYLKGII
jgi:nucleoside-diphosphate-sugar epimerase